MISQTVFLFVGGPLDGQRKQVELGSRGLPLDFFRCEQLERSGDFWNPGRIGLYEYKLTQVMDADRQVIAFYQGADVQNPFARLIAGYKAEADLGASDTRPDSLVYRQGGAG
jgi:hypothetical protein